MKYIRNSRNYFRETEERIENAKELNAAVMKQNTTQPAKFWSEDKTLMLQMIGLIVLALLFAVIAAFIFSHDQNFAMYSFLWGLSASSLLFVIVPIAMGINLNHKCTQESSATCIGYDDTIIYTKHGSHIESCPIYKFNEGDTEYIVYSHKYEAKTSKLPPIGAVSPIKFDPKDPNRCVIDNKIYWRANYIAIGVVFFILLIYFLFILSQL